MLWLLPPTPFPQLQIPSAAHVRKVCSGRKLHITFRHRKLWLLRSLVFVFKTDMLLIVTSTSNELLRNVYIDDLK